MLSKLKYLFLIFSDFLAPRNCLVCDEYLENKPRRFEFICDRCFDNIPLAPEPYIIYNKFINNFEQDDIAVSNAISLFSIKENHNYMKLIYALKYNGFFRIGEELGKELAVLLKQYVKTDYNAIIPVPIHKARFRERGYNQSEYIAKGIRKIINVEINTSILKRSVYTGTQTVLDKYERLHNVKDAFKINSRINIKSKTFLLVDDVLTTGSTVNACAYSLLEAGAKSVDVATLVDA